MVVVPTYPYVRYWSEVLCSTIPNLMSDFEVKVMDLENFFLKFFVEVFKRQSGIQQAALSFNSSINFYLTTWAQLFKT